MIKSERQHSSTCSTNAHPDSSDMESGRISPCVLYVDDGAHIITAVQATAPGLNIIPMHQQWYGQIDGFSCTHPAESPIEAMQAALSELQQPSQHLCTRSVARAPWLV